MFTGNGGPLNMAVFGRDDRRIVTAGEDGTVREYDTASGRQVAMLKTDDQAVASATFRRDGRRVVTAGLAADDGGIVRLWNPSAPGPGRVVARGDDEFISAELSPDGRLLLTATEFKAVVRDARTGRRRVTITLPEAETRDNPFARILTARFSPDATQVVTTHYNKTARLWDARTGKLMRSLEGHDGIVYGAEFSRDGRRVVTAGGDSTARIWDPADGRLLRTLTSPAGTLQCAAFSPDGRWVAAGAVTGDVSVWEVATGQLVAELHPHAELVTSLAFSEDSRWVLASSDDRTATMVLCESCRPLEELLAVARQRERSAGGGP